MSAQTNWLSEFNPELNSIVEAGTIVIIPFSVSLGKQLVPEVVKVKAYGVLDVGPGVILGVPVTVI